MAMMQGSNRPRNVNQKTESPVSNKAMKPENLAPPTGMEGREEDLAKAMQMLVKTIKIQQPYPHDTNDALLKAHLNAIQFAKNQGLLEELVAHDSATMQPILSRTKAMREKTGHKELPQSFDPEFTNRALKNSLARLQTDYVDVYGLHNPKLRHIHDDTIFQTLDGLIGE